MSDTITLRDAEDLIEMSPEFIVTNLLRWVKEGRMLDIKLRRGDLVKIRETYLADRASWNEAWHDEEDGA